MNISNSTASQVAELLGNMATEKDGETLQAFLIERGVNDSNDVSESEWLRLVDACFNRAN